MSAHGPLAGFQRAHELDGRGADLGALGGERQRADVVRVDLRYLEERRTAVLSEIEDEVGGISDVAQTRDSVEFLVGYLSGDGDRPWFEIAADT